LAKVCKVKVQITELHVTAKFLNIKLKLGMKTLQATTISCWKRHWHTI